MAKNSENGGQDITESYLDNDIPRLMKLFFIGIIIWGVLFSLYFILSGYNSEKRFEEKGLGITVTSSKVLRS